jgi:hypothetical protein
MGWRNVATLLEENSPMGTFDRSRCGTNGVDDAKELKLSSLRKRNKKA